MRALGLAIIAFVALQIYLGKSAEFPSTSPQPFVPIIEQPAAAIRSAEQFRCDGRETCAQMTSKEEAQFFVSNCPNTKMDGDGDGQACENDTRF